MKYVFYKFYDVEYSYIINKNHKDTIILDTDVKNLNLDSEIITKLLNIGLDRLSNLILSSETYLRFFHIKDNDVNSIYNSICEYMAKNDKYFYELNLDLPSYLINKNDLNDDCKLEQNLDEVQINVDKTDSDKNIYLNIDDSYLNKDIEILGLSNRAINSLKKNNYNFVKDIYELTDADYYRIRNLGIGSIKEIKSKLSSYLKSKCAIDNVDDLEDDLENEFEENNSLSSPKNYVNLSDEEKDIYYGKDGISNLNLSNRSNNSLVKSGILSIKDLINMTEYDLWNIKSLGVKSINEIKNCISEYLKSHINYDNSSNGFDDESIDIKDINYIKSLIFSNRFNKKNNIIFINNTSYGFEDNDVSNLILNTKTYRLINSLGVRKISEAISLGEYYLNSLEGVGTKSIRDFKNALANYIFDNIKFIDENEYIEEQLCADIISLIKSAEFDGIKENDLVTTFSNMYDNDLVTRIIKKILEEKIVFLYDDKLFYTYQSFPQFLYSFETSIDKDIMYSRLDGITLEELGQKYGITRERIRQKQMKFLEKHCKNRKFREDRFKYIYETYCFSRDEFNEIFKEKERTYNYLTMMYKSGKINFEEAINDERIPNRLRSLIQKYMYRNYIDIDGEVILKNKQNLLKYYLKHYCKEQKLIDDILKEYREFALKYISEKEVIISSCRYLEGFLNRTSNIISCYNRKYRYYDFNYYDFTELLEYIDLDNYQDIQISTGLFYDNNLELMKKYDIQNKYELHNILKQIYEKFDTVYDIQNKSNIEFIHMPLIQIGNFDRREYLSNIITSLGVSKKTEIVNEISKNTGVSPKVVESLWLDGINDFRYKENKNEVFYINSGNLDKEQKKELEKEFSQEVYTTDEAKYKLSTLGYNNILILAQIGFNISKNFICKNTTSIYKYLYNKLCNMDIINLNDSELIPFKKVIHHCMYDLCKNFKFVEFENGNYISIKKLEKFGITKEDIIKFTTEVLEASKGEIFSVKTIINDYNINTSLFDLGFDNLFIESILKSSGLFNYYKYYTVCGFCDRNIEYLKKDIFESVINKNRKIESSDLMKYMKDNYGIEVPFYQIKELLSDTAVYYDSIMDTFYMNYNVYYEEI